MKALLENQELASLFKENFPFWDKLTEIEKETFVNSSQYISFPKGTNIHNGNECTGIILIRKGSLRLYILSDEGKEITLYRLFPGEMCMLSASCVLNNITFDVFVDADENAECIIVGGCAYAALAERNTSAKIFALETALARFSDVMWVMQQILFMSMDKRLAIFLLDEVSKTGGDTVHLTHEQIAKYMGSAREVVTRMLKYFSSEGIVELSRGGIKLIDMKRLRSLAI